MTTEVTTSATTASGNDAWEGFVTGPWTEDIDVRDFIQRNYTPYDGDASFLADATDKTLRPVSYTHLTLPTTPYV